MLVDWNEGYINACLQPDIIPVEDNNNYIPTSTWGYITGDISVQSDLMSLLTNIESGLTTDQIALLVNVDDKLDEVLTAIAELEQNGLAEITDITTALSGKANSSDVYTKSEIDSKNYLTEHQDLSGYATENWVYTRGYISAETDPVWSSEKHKYALKSELPNTTGLASESWVKQQGYLTKHQSLANYYTKNEVDMAINNLDVNLSGYATEVWVSEQLLAKANASSVYTKSEIDSRKYTTQDWTKEQLLVKANANDVYTKAEIESKKYATQEWTAEQLLTKVNNKDVWTKADWASGALNKDVIKLGGYLTFADLSDYATFEWVDDRLTNYYTKGEINTAFDKTEVELKAWVNEGLTNYYTKDEVDTAIENVEVDLTGYATEEYVENKLESKVDYTKIWTGTEEEWVEMDEEQRDSYIIAMVEL